ncbi:MAG: hypothetical protein ABJR05_14855 [Balneola sp.]
MKKDQIVASTLIFYLLLISCSIEETKNQVIDLSKVESITPNELIIFNSIDSLYFGYLGINSFPQKDGSFILGVQTPSHLVHVCEDGKKIIGLTSTGRGPGEISEIGIPTLGEDSTINIYDRNKKSNVTFDSSLKPIDEFQISSNQDLYVDVIYQINEDNYLIEMNSIKWIIDSDESKYLVFSIFNKATNNYGKTVKFLDRQYAQTENPMPPPPVKPYANHLGSDRAISYSEKQMYTFSKTRESMFLYNTGSNEIVEVDFNFDTLKTIDVSLPTEEITESEIDSIKKKIQEPDALRNLVSRLPNWKTPIERMLIDHKNRFWLKLNLRGDYEKWIIMNQDGIVEKFVNLPKNSFLTHVSERHLGIRLDDTTFGLFLAIE